MPFTVRAEIHGLEQALAQLEGLKQSLARRIVRRAVTKAARVLTRKVKSRVPRESGGGAVGRARAGLLRKSIGQRVKTTKDKAVVAIVGPRRKMKKLVGVVMRGRRKGQPIYANPTRYAHLVEKGTKHSQPQSFLKSAIDASQEQIAQIVIQEIQTGLEQYNAKRLGR